MSHRPTALASLARYALAAAAELGLEEEPLLAAAGLSRELVDDPDGRVPVASLMKLWEAAALASGEPGYGLLVAQRLAAPSTVHVVGFAARSAATLGAAIETVGRFTRVMNETTSFRLIRGPETSVLAVQPASPHPRWPRAYAEVVMAGYLRVGRLFTGDELQCLRATFQHPAPKDRAAYEQVFGPALSFEAKDNSLTFATSALDLPVRFADAGMHAYFEGVMTGLVKSLGETTAVRERVRRAVGDHLADSPPLAAVARSLGMSARTLQRALRDEGVTFESVRDEVRREVAFALLEDRRLGVAEIAAFVGFSDGSAFRAAFRRWKGRSPREARRAVRHGLD